MTKQNIEIMKNISPEKLEELIKEFDNYETETLEETAEKYAIDNSHS